MGFTLFLQLMTLTISVQHFPLFNQVGIIYKCIVSSVCLVVINCVGVVLYSKTMRDYKYQKQYRLLQLHNFDLILYFFVLSDTAIKKCVETSGHLQQYVMYLQNTNHTVRTNPKSIKENRMEAKSILLKWFITKPVSG